MLEFLRVHYWSYTFPAQINDLSDYVICNIAIYADDTILYCKCYQAFDWWQQLELASERESDLRYIVYCGRNWIGDFNAGKIQLGQFDRPYDTGAIDVMMTGSVLEEKSSFKMLDLTFSSNLDQGSYIISIAKTVSKKIGAFIPSVKFSANIRLDEDVLKTFFVFVFRRRLDQDEYVHLSSLSSEDVFKASWLRPVYSSWLYVFSTSSRSFQDVIETSCKSVFQTSSRCLAKTTSRLLRNVFKRY